MDNIEQEFFRVFGIEPKYNYVGHYLATDKSGVILPPVYPKITSDTLIKLITYINIEIADKYADAKPISISGFSFDGVKESILSQSIELKDDLKQKIQQLFSE